MVQSWRTQCVFNMWVMVRWNQTGWHSSLSVLWCVWVKHLKCYRENKKVKLLIISHNSCCTSSKQLPHSQRIWSIFNCFIWPCWSPSLVLMWGNCFKQVTEAWMHHWQSISWTPSFSLGLLVKWVFLLAWSSSHCVPILSKSWMPCKTWFLLFWHGV